MKYEIVSKYNYSNVAVEAPESMDREKVLTRRLIPNTVTLELTVRHPGGNYVTVRAVPDG